MLLLLLCGLNVSARTLTKNTSFSEGTTVLSSKLTWFSADTTLLSSDDTMFSTDTTRFSVWFEQDVAEIDPGYGANNYAFDQLIGLLNIDTMQVQSVELNAYCSPDGNRTYNLELGAARLASVREMILSAIDSGDMTIINNDIDISWLQVLDMFNQNHPATQGLKSTEYIKYIIQKAISKSEETNRNVNSFDIRNALRNDNHDGIAWDESCQLFPFLRRVDAIIVLVPVEVLPVEEPAPVVTDADSSEVVVASVVGIDSGKNPSVSFGKNLGESSNKANGKDTRKDKANATAKVQNTSDSVRIQRGVCRIKTNLLYDAAAVANLSIEAGFAKHWSIEVLGTFSPWDFRPKHKIRTLLIQPEIRFYPRKNFRGSYFGIEGHYGWYNIVLPNFSARYQDINGNSPLWGAGLIYGCVVPFGKHLGMDFNIGAGYTRLNYDCFYNIENGARFTSVSRDFWGPTKAGITFYIQF